MCACVVRACVCVHARISSFFHLLSLLPLLFLVTCHAFIVLGGAEPVYITHSVLMKVCRDFGNDAQNNFGLRLVISFCKSF